MVDGIFAEASRHYVLIDYVAEWTSGEPVAGDDAAAAVFMPVEAALGVVAWDETRRVIAKAVSDRRTPTASSGPVTYPPWP